MISIVIFILFFAAGSAFFLYNANKVRRNILLGKEVDRKDKPAERLKIMTLVALGQKKMFTRPVPAILHLFLYAAFVITQIELIEIILDGALGNHRMLRPSLGGFYTFIVSFIEILSVLAFIGTIAFLSRRNLLKVPRLVKSELNGWPKLDANFILLGEITLICFIFMMNGADEVLYSMGLSHAQNTGGQSLGLAISSYLGPLLFGGMSEGSLHLLERIGWWGHITMVLGFLNYLPYSKHFHIVLAFPNIYFSNLDPKGKFTNLVSVTNEVKAMLDPSFTPPPVDPEKPMRFGAKEVTDLSWKQLLDAYSCTECGRCTSACPANITGKLLSPRKIMMSTRDRLEDMGKNIDVNVNGSFKDDGKSLLGDYITTEELWACTSCNACVEECPVNIDPLSIITDMRRFVVMEQSAAPTELNMMFTNIENNGAPWQFAQADRLKWSKE